MEKIAWLLIVLLLATGTISAKVVTGTISGRIVSTSITLSNQNLGNLVANDTCYYYWNGSEARCGLIDKVASDIVPFASIDFALDSGWVEVSVGTNNSLPNTTRLLLDNDKIPSNTTVDRNQVQLTGVGNKAEITYFGINNDSRIMYSQDGDVYVFVNTGEAEGGDINTDITLTVK